MPDYDDSPEGWSSQDKFHAVGETAALSEAAFGEYCRRKGLHTRQIERWKEACQRANDWSSTENVELARKRREDAERIRNLEKEVHRKDKASVESAALLVLKEKVQELRGGRGRLTTAQQRRELCSQMEQAVQSGARLSRSCEGLGLHPRTLRRRQADGTAGDRSLPADPHAF
jgi:hypothetical protein